MALFRDTLVRVLLACQMLCWAYGSIFHQFLTKEVLLNLLDVAERELKVFIYPIPDHVKSYKDENPAKWQECEGREFELHFCIEELFVRYLQDIRDNFQDYPHVKTNFVTHDAEKANTFVINHTWVMTNSVEKHLRPIVNNVVDNYPYYNRSLGHDHFLVYPYDLGVLCSGRHLHDDWSPISNCPVDENLGHNYFCHVSRIINTSFIGNYGMDSKYFRDNDYSFGLKKCVGKCPSNSSHVVCHRPAIDIVTPQYLLPDTHQYYTHHANNNNSIQVKRKFDSCFKGNYHFQRWVLEKIKINSEGFYISNHTEKFQETRELQNCIFAYHMCGQACWSHRLYDALARSAVPIIIADGAIQAFERFLDWRQFSIKISVPEMFQDRFTFRFRHILRKQSDLFRRGNHRFYPSGYVPAGTELPGDFRGKKYGFVLRKMLNARDSMEWFDFRDLKGKTNAFRMIVLEMFCRMVRRKPAPVSDDFVSYFSRIDLSRLASDEKFQHFVCSRKSDFIARLRYVR